MLAKVALAVGALAAVLLFNRLLAIITKNSKCRPLPLPPGPPGLPIIGNVHQNPKSHAWLQWHQWSKTYGPIIYLNMLGQPIVVLHSAKAAQDLLARRGAMYSDRPRLVLAGELALKGLHLVLMPYDARYKLHQRLEAPLLSPRAASSYQPLLDLETRQLLFDLLTPTASAHGVDYHHQLERTMASVTYSLMYGYRLPTGREPELVRAHAIMKEFAAMMSDNNLVDIFPFLEKLPIPWPWRHKAERHFEEQRDLHNTNLQRALGNRGWNFAKEMAASAEAKQMSEEEFAFDIGILADAALETTVLTGNWFIVAWLTQDKASGFVAKAQKLLDDVVGRDRLPTFADRPNLVYIDAIVEEVLRWRPIGITGIPHVTKVEDQYEGFRIPAGTIVFANQWSITRDATVFGGDADAFVPERWLVDGNGGGCGPGDVKARPKSEGAAPLRDIPSTGFGFGRRICTGQHIARNELWMQVALLLWAFNLDGAVDPHTGERVEVDPMAMAESLIIRPLPFNAIFRPRGPWVEDLVLKQCDTSKEDFVELLEKIGRERAPWQGDLK
ncbi:cytochrome [Diaporthe amygdali]|uniref:cytochrome n=1 Tax=Phomopsis amygdali TaxID=1214568 RepID=UPI0022FF36CA|nr:cytochrome [Diaporthe amygdali]KAJ0117156.1 cytochrome [Diaporthe amygdali]